MPVNWWQLGLTTLLGLLTVAGAYIGSRLGAKANDRATEQRELAARREEWWRRFTWAAELALDQSSDRRTVGLTLMMKLARSSLAEHDEFELLDVFQQRVLGKLLDDADAKEA